MGPWARTGHRWLQVFTGDTLGTDRRRTAVAIEPMTCPPNAFVTTDDLLVLQPGQTVTHTWGIRVLGGQGSQFSRTIRGSSQPSNSTIRGMKLRRTRGGMVTSGRAEAY